MRGFGRGFVAIVSASALVLVLLPATSSSAARSTGGEFAAHGRKKYPTVAAAQSQRARKQAAAAAAEPQLAYGGGVHGIGVTTGPPRVYLVFWGSQWGTASPAGSTNLSGDTAGVAPRLEALFTGLGTNNELWSGVATQYCEGLATGATSCPADSAHVGYPTGGALAGIWDDTATAVSTNATGHQIGVEAVNAAAHFGNTTAASNRNAQYVIVSPKGTHPDGFNTATGNFCAWHDYNGDPGLPGGPVSSPYGDIAFTNLPYIPDAGSSCGASYVNTGPAGALDGVTMVEGHEFSETITDQNPAGGWTDSAGEENADKCAWNGVGGTGGAQNVAFANGSFAMQATWSNDSASCRISHPIVTNGGTTNDFSISESPTSRSVVRGSATTTTVTTAVVAGAAQTVTLTAAGLPAGATASFSPASVTAGSASTLTIATTSVTPTGTFGITITGSAPSGSHSSNFSLTVTAPVSNDFSISASPTSGSAVAGGSVTSTVSTATVSGTAQTVALSATGLPAGATASFSPASVTSGGSSTLTIATSAATVAGTYGLTITGTATSGAHATGFTLTVTAAGSSTLTNGVPVTGIAGAQGSTKYWSMQVPAGQSTLTFTISGGTGDADLYTRFGAQPTTTAYTCRPYIGGNNETCTATNPSAGTWWVMIRGYSAYSGVTLKGTYAASGVAVLVNGVAVTNIAGATGSTQYWKLTVPGGQAKVVFTISSGSGDADLYVRRGAQPTTSTYDCRPYLIGNNETCTFTAPVAADYYVMIRGYVAYSGVTLKGLYS